MFWIFDANSGDDTLMFIVVAEQCLYRAKEFSASHIALSVRSQGVHKHLGGDRSRIADPSWPKACSTPYAITLSSESCGKDGMVAPVFPRNHYV